LTVDIIALLVEKVVVCLSAIVIPKKSRCPVQAIQEVNPFCWQDQMQILISQSINFKRDILSLTQLALIFSVGLN